jgi:DnaJ family protein B protein 4
MSNSHYDVLGVSQKASDSEIKKAYRSLSLKYHPDRNPSAEAAAKIREVNDAYEILSNTSKRRQYDMELSMSKMPFGLGGFGGPMGNMGRGMGPMGPMGPMGGMNMGGMPFAHMSSVDDSDINGIFQMLFGGGMPPGSAGMPEIHVFHGGRPSFQQAQKPSPILKQISITMEQAYYGCRMPVEIERWTMIGELKVQEEETIYITIPAGIDENEMIVVEQKGNVANEMVKGDVKITIQIENTTVFKRHGLDLIYKKAISLKEALCGFGFEIHHMNGKILNLNNKNNPTVIKPNYRKVVQGLGMNRDGTAGNLIIEFLVEFPDFLDKHQISAISEILE